MSLATAYTHSKDGLTWTFTIRQGVKFHDGTTLNAQAVQFSIEREIKLNQGVAFIWAPVKTIDAPNARTVVFHLNYPAPIDLIASSPYGAFIMSPTAVQSHPANWLTAGHDAGSGPYELYSFQPGTQVVLKAFPQYWQGWKGPHFQYVVINTVTEASSRRELVEKGGADFADNITPAGLAAMAKEPAKVKILESPEFENLVLALNTLKPPLNNVLVRQALSYAFPYAEAVSDAAGGLADTGARADSTDRVGLRSARVSVQHEPLQGAPVAEQAGYAKGGSHS